MQFIEKFNEVRLMIEVIKEQIWTSNRRRRKRTEVAELADAICLLQGGP